MYLTPYDAKFRRRAKVSPMGSLQTSDPVRLVGSTFSGTTIDPNFWSSTVTAAATNTQSGGQVVLATGTSANGTARMDSVATARYIGASPNYFRGVFRVNDTGTTNNVRRWGAFDDNNGFFFQLSGTTFSVVTRKATTDTAVNSGSFNGNGSLSSQSYAIDTNAHTYEIWWTNTTVAFLIDDVAVHTVSAATTTASETLNLKVRVQNVNSGGSTTNVSMDMRVATINRLGKEMGRPRYYNNANVNETRVLKYGPGTIHAILIGDPASAGTITLYDNTAGSGTAIATIDTSTFTIPTTLFFGDSGLDYFTGLTYVSASSPGNFTVIYE